MSPMSSTRVAVTLLIVGVLVAVVTWITLDGTDPIHFTAPQG